MFNEYTNSAGTYTPTDNYASIKFAIASMLGKIETATIVKVIAVKPNGLLAGMVDIQPMVQQLTAEGEGIDHGIIYSVPYVRVQGGDNAIIIDPKVGDIGVAVFCHRDITNVVENKATAKPASFRQYDLSDALYLGGLLNGEPKQYIQFTDDGIVLHSPTQISLNSPLINLNGNVALNGGLVQNASDIGSNAVFNGSIHATGEITSNNVSLSGHTHGNVKNGVGVTGEPI